MPLYEYECDNNGHRFEVIQKFSDPPIQTCPTCGGPVHKLISSPAFQFKGSGWYVTDYARKDSGGKAAETGEKKAESKDKGDSTDKAAGTSADKDTSAKKTESADTKTKSDTKTNT